MFRETINSNYEKIYEYSDHKNIVNYVNFSDFSKNLLFASGSLNGEIVIHQYKNDNFYTNVISAHDFGVNSFSFSPENKIISCGNDGLIKIWEENLETGQWSTIDTIETETITTSVAYNPCKKDTFASCGEDGVVIFWQKKEDKWNQKTVMTHVCEMVKVEWNDNGSNLIGIGADGIENLYEENILTFNE